MNIQEAYSEIVKKENFKTWFGKSILHDKGVPHTFYHGTDADISAFSHEHIGRGQAVYGPGFYFTNNTGLAAAYTDNGKHGGNVIPVHLRVEKPIYTHEDKPFTRTQITKIISYAPNHKESLMNFGDVDYKGHHQVLNQAVDTYGNVPKHIAIHRLRNDFYNGKDSEFLTNLTKHTGHDAVIHKYSPTDTTTIINIFHPNQIKSSIGNTGEYSKYSNKITESGLL